MTAWNEKGGNIRLHGYHSITAWLLLSIYGIQVCPFVDSLSTVEVMAPIGVILLLGAVLRYRVGRRWVAQAGVEQEVRRTLMLDLLLFVGAGVVVALFNTVTYAFPIESGLKVMLGFLTFGFFAALDLALDHEYRLPLQIKQENRSLLLADRFLPLAAKFSIFAAVSLLLVGSIFFLVINKDLSWLLQLGSEGNLVDARRSILLEFSFIITVLFAYLIRVILAYSRNMNHFLDHERSVLRKVTNGDLDCHVTLSTQDEFAYIGEHTNRMIDALKAGRDELLQTQSATILSLGALAETRDPETGAHLLRTQRYIRALATELAKDPRYSDELPAEVIELLYQSAPLHDIGKVGIPDNILLKPGPLDDREFHIMKGHPDLGVRAIKAAESHLGENSFLRIAREIAGTHHEKWDGSGYPQGLTGGEIPLSGRLMAVADVYDALISKRVYKPAFSHEKAMGIIIEGSGIHFDPVLVTVMERIEANIVDIASQYQDL